MELTKTDLSKMFSRAAQALLDSQVQLGKIDSRFGDGDHGVTMGKIAKTIEGKLPDLEQSSLKAWFDALGMAVMNVAGGSAGPLYGTLLGGFAEALDADTQTIDAVCLKRMFASALSEMQEISSAEVGDKTMMDALIPAVEAAQAAPDDVRAVLDAASAGAQAGAKASEQFVAKFGRARNYGDKTLGTPDAGAVSTSVLFRGLAEGFD